MKPQRKNKENSLRSSVVNNQALRLQNSLQTNFRNKSPMKFKKMMLSYEANKQQVNATMNGHV